MRRSPLTIPPPRCCLIAAMLLVGSLGIASPARSYDELWARIFHSPVPSQDVPRGLAVHADGSMTLTGSSDRLLLVSRLTATGQPLWTFVDAGSGYPPPMGAAPVFAFGDDVVVAVYWELVYSTAYGQLVALDRNGLVRWRLPYTQPIKAAIPEGDGLIVVGGDTHAGPPHCSVGVSRVDLEGNWTWHQSVPFYDPGTGGKAGSRSRPGLLNCDGIAIGRYLDQGVLVLSDTWDGIGLHLIGNQGDARFETPVYLAGRSCCATAFESGPFLTVAGYLGQEHAVSRFMLGGPTVFSATWPATGWKPLLAVDSVATVVADQVPGEWEDVDVRVAEYDDQGNVSWESFFGSGSGDEIPTALRLTDDGVVIGATLGEQFGILRYDRSGALLSSSTLGEASTGSSVLVPASGGGLLALATTLSGDDSDILVASVDSSGGLAELARVASTRNISPEKVWILGDGRVLTVMRLGLRLGYSPLGGFMLVIHEPDGSGPQSTVVPELRIGDVALDPGENVLVGVYDRSHGWLQRYGLSGDLHWQVEVEPFEGRIAVSANGTAFVSSSAVLRAVAADGRVRWSYTGPERLTDLAVTDSGQVYAVYVGVGIGSDRELHSISSTGELIWSRTFDNLPVLTRLVVGEDDGLYWVGRGAYTYGAPWTTYRLTLDGQVEAVSEEQVGAGIDSRGPSHALPLPGGGVVVAGTVGGDFGDLDVFVLRYDAPESRRVGGDPPPAELDLVWRFSVTEVGDQTLGDMALDSVGNLLLAISDSQARSARTLMVDRDGTLVWEREYQGSRLGSVPSAVHAGAGGRVAMAGRNADGSASIVRYDVPTAVEITRLEAWRRGEDVEITWRTAHGIDATGFRVGFSTLREGPYGRLHREPLPASARSYVHRGGGPHDQTAYYVLDVVGRDGTTERYGPVVAERRTSNLPPGRLLVEAPRPNPSNGAVEFRFLLPARQPVRLEVFESSGRMVARLLDGQLDAGLHRVRWEVGEAAAGPGVYFHRLQAGSAVETGKIVIEP